MFATNYDPNDTASGVYVADRSPMHDAIRAIVDAITGAPGSVWSEVVVGESPAFLDQYASTLEAGSSGYEGSTSASFGNAENQATMYLSTDPGLNAETPHCRLYRIGAEYYGIKGGILDTKTVPDPPGRNDGWAVLFDVNNDDSLYTIVSETDRGLITYPHRLYFWMHDDLLMLHARREDNASYGGGNLVLSPPVPANGTIDRSSFPFIFGPDWISRSLTQAVVPARPGQVAGTGAYLAPEIGFWPDFPDGQGREILQRVRVYRDGPSSWYLDPIRGIRALRSGVLSELDTITVDGVEYVAARVANGQTLLVANQDVSAN